jgi:hypothetical protein
MNISPIDVYADEGESLYFRNVGNAAYIQAMQRLKFKSINKNNYLSVN